MTSANDRDALERAAEMIRGSAHTTAFTGAGISVESGVPPFRGENGLWSRYDPQFLEIDYFLAHPEESWRVVKDIFYEFFGEAEPNRAHRALAGMEDAGLLNAVVTQNIDNLHRNAGSKEVIEFHGTSRRLVCLECGRRFDAAESFLDDLPPRCADCSGLLKPDFVFFGETIPDRANKLAFREAKTADVFVLIGTTGEVHPATLIPMAAKENGAGIIEVNTEASNYTGSITDVFLRGTATEMMYALLEELDSRQV